MEAITLMQPKHVVVGETVPNYKGCSPGMVGFCSGRVKS